MIKTTRLPEEMVEKYSEEFWIRSPQGPVDWLKKVEKTTMFGIDEIQALYISPRTGIKKHGHEKNQWEVWIDISRKRAYVCLKGEEHELVNKSGEMLMIVAIKGHEDYSYDDFEMFFCDLGFSVDSGSIVIEYE